MGLTSDPNHLSLIRDRVAIHTEYMLDMLRTHDYRFVKLFDQQLGSLVTPPNLDRRANDWKAAAYIHALALNHNLGDDCVDSNGNVFELKLAYLNGRDCWTGKRGALVHGASGSSLASVVSAKFKVYPGTLDTHHNRDTVMVLMSYDHNCYITGFVMHGDKVQELLTEGGQNTVQRRISLGQFMRYGYEIGSSIPHMGWDDYFSSLSNMVKAREGRITGSDYQNAVDQWVSLADPRNLKKL